MAGAATITIKLTPKEFDLLRATLTARFVELRRAVNEGEGTPAERQQMRETAVRIEALRGSLD